ncbi:hypothetical protein FHA82_23180 [Salmonella enterica]|uniref:hypothetical protein n=1 Tax=Salmonella enterica TaxID=28901 RepID=UPI0009B0E75F|nr:hypothetical protein [Salmonella enterica]ECI0837414.1 hypothetical protein [Salmonella enterica subsp. diarizonae]WGI51858.1 hypothetical protein QBX66_10980 [Salmonella enterica subsp. diarizonae serovar 48:i:z]EBB5478882.1 hypothetical protein [Salmonella enterica]EKS3671431.1 hypothetical protein [Salmonella enterica]ELW6562506.1 hypothetical protein [Salmonella enterica]
MNLLIKKVVLGVIVCSAFASAPFAMADVGSPTVPTSQKVSALTMHVIGTITNTTCDIRPYTTAGADATTLNMGVITKAAASQPVSFFLKPANGCTDGITSGSTSADITWESNGLTEHGISNMYGTAKNVHVELSPENGSGNSAAEIDTSASSVADGGLIKTGAQTVVYNKIATTASTPSPLPFKYNVKFVSDDGSDMNAGTVDTDISYTVAYK